MPQSTPISRVTLRGADADLGPLATVERDAAEAIVAVGTDALERAVDDGPSLPILPVGVDGRTQDGSRGAADAAEAIAAGRYRTVTHPVLAVGVDEQTPTGSDDGVRSGAGGGERVDNAVFDVTLMTSEPAQISEYALSTEGERLFEVRADGVVASTPLGSDGYGRAAGGPVVAPGGGISVVPVAPFTTRGSPWVLPGPLTLHVERDESDISLFLDGEERRRVGCGEPVTVDVVDEFTCLRPLPE